MEARMARVVIAAGLGTLLVSSAPTLAVASPVETSSAEEAPSDRASRQTIEVSTVEELEHAVNSATGPLDVLVTGDLVVTGGGEGGALVTLSNSNPEADVRVARKEEAYATDTWQIVFGDAEAKEPSSVMLIADFAGKISLDNLSIVPNAYGGSDEDSYIPNVVHGLEIRNSKDVWATNLDVLKMSDMAVVIGEESSCHIDSIRTLFCDKERIYVCGGSSLDIAGEISHIVEYYQEIAGEIVLEDSRVDSVSHVGDDRLVDYRILEDGQESHRAYCTMKDKLKGSILASGGQGELPVFSKSFSSLLGQFGEGDTITIYGGAECDCPISVPAGATIRGDGDGMGVTGLSTLTYKSRNTSVPDTFVTLSGDGAKLEGLSVGSIFDMDHLVTVRDCANASIVDCSITDEEGKSPLLIDGAEASLARINFNDGFDVYIGGPYTSIELAMDADSPTIPSLAIEDPTWMTGDYLKDVSEVYAPAKTVEAIRARLGNGATQDDVLAELGGRVTVDGISSEFKIDDKGGAYLGKAPWEWVEDTGDDEPGDNPDDGQGGSTSGDEDGSTNKVTITNPDGSKTERTTEVVVGGDGTVVETFTERTSGGEGNLTIERISIEVTNRYGDVILSKSTETTMTPGGTTTTTESVDGKLISINASISARDVAAGMVELPVPELDSSQGGGSPRISLSAPKGALVTVPVKNAAGSELPPASVALALVGEDGKLTPCPKTAQVSGGLILEVPGDCDLELVCPSIDFPDISGEEWYAKAGVADFVSSRDILTGLINQDGTASFGGGEPTTRAMFVTMLSRLELEPVADDGLSFPDVDPNAWYANAAAWGSQEGIVEGFGDGESFGGEEVVTREQMAVFLMRYAQWLGVDTSARANLTFPDSASISPWAKEAVSWATAEGYLRGHDSGMFAPQDGASRAEASAVLMRFINGMYE